MSRPRDTFCLIFSLRRTYKRPARKLTAGQRSNVPVHARCQVETMTPLMALSCVETQKSLFVDAHARGATLPPRNIRRRHTQVKISINNTVHGEPDFSKNSLPSLSRAHFRHPFCGAFQHALLRNKQILGCVGIPWHSLCVSDAQTHPAPAPQRVTTLVFDVTFATTICSWFRGAQASTVHWGHHHHFELSDLSHQTFWDTRLQNQHRNQWAVCRKRCNFLLHSRNRHIRSRRFAGITSGMCGLTWQVPRHKLCSSLWQWTVDGGLNAALENELVWGLSTSVRLQTTCMGTSEVRSTTCSELHSWGECGQCQHVFHDLAHPNISRSSSASTNSSTASTTSK